MLMQQYLATGCLLHLTDNMWMWQCLAACYLQSVTDNMWMQQCLATGYQLHLIDGWHVDMAMFSYRLLLTDNMLPWQCFSLRLWAVPGRWRPQERGVAGARSKSRLLPAQKWGMSLSPSLSLLSVCLSLFLIVCVCVCVSLFKSSNKRT